MKILDILADKLKLSPKEETVFDTWLNGLERDALTLSGQSTATGGGAGVNVGNVEISLEDGVTLYNPDTGARTIYLDPDGDAWFGDDIDSPADTALSIFSNAQTYNSEDMGEGDLLIGDNSSGKANMQWDKSTGRLNFRTGTTSGIILSTSGRIQSGNYSSGAAGWAIDPDGDAEFNSITARGTFKTAVFEVGNIAAVGGHVLVSKNAGEVYTEVRTPSATGINYDLDIKDDSLGNEVAAIGDVLRIKGWNGTTLMDTWATVEGTTSHTGYTTYDCNTESGILKLIVIGMAVVNYGQANAGVIHLEAGSQSTRLRIATHAGAPWTTMTNMVVLGNMRDTYDTGANDRYGIGIGDHSSGNYMSYNAETADAFILRGGDGAVTIDANGLMLLGTSSAPAPEAIRWYYDDGGGPMDEQGGRMFFGFDGVAGHDGVLYIEAMWDGAAGHNPWGNVGLIMSAWNTATQDSIDLTLSVTGKTLTMSGAALDTVHIDDGVLKVDDDIYTVPWTDYSGTSTVIGWTSFTNKKIEYKKIGKLVFVNFVIVGTSDPGANGVYARFSLPYSEGQSGAPYFICLTKDDGTNGIGYGYIANNVAYFTKNCNAGSSNWTQSGEKRLIGQFQFQTT